MNSADIRNTFLEYFKSKEHQIVPSSSMVVKNDPTLMFTNAGMNQFKDIFLGNVPVKYKRIADTQKCLRVSGKHNDLEEVGKDTYHHTMFEMLGNWSFGDYFKKEAIAWAYELLTEVLKIDKSRLYITVFGGDESDKLPKDMEAFNYWKEIVDEKKIIFGNKKDNFWEMGDTGPCGPCSEVHFDIRNDEERNKVDGVNLVNTDNPQVIEIWNLVFIEFNRQSDASLVSLPDKHVDTGMGFERLCMVLQGKQSNYDTDVFSPLIKRISELSGVEYGKNEKSDVAMRVIADHLRAISFAISDGQLPSNNKAGYVIRRILRRAVRYGYTYLNFREPFLSLILPTLVNQMKDVFPELANNEDFVSKVMTEEEYSFLRTLANGLKRFDDYINIKKENNIIEGDFSFELFDTYGFPLDLTRLMAEEINWTIDIEGFNNKMQEQKSRSRLAAEKNTDDWIVFDNSINETEFIGYDFLEAEVNITKYRRVKTANNEFYQLVFDKTPFYAESGGQVGDRGVLINENENIIITDTNKENNLIVHISKTLPSNPVASFNAKVDINKRQLTMNNHSATHLMNAALREVLGNHIEQKGSLVDEEHLRFDFSHFSKLTDEEIATVETIVNKKIRENISLHEQRNVPIEKAMKEMKAVGVFGEKYGDFVRVIIYDNDFSRELCGGTHVGATGQIGYFKITSESAIAAGVRRIEAITADKAEEFINVQFKLLEDFKEILKNRKDPLKSLNNLIDENTLLQKEIEKLKKEKVINISSQLINNSEQVNSVNFIACKLELDTASVKDLAFEVIRNRENTFVIIGNETEGKANLTLMITEDLVKKGMNAGTMIRELAKEIGGGGGGQPHFATSGGKNPAGLEKALLKAKEMIK